MKNDRHAESRRGGGFGERAGALYVQDTLCIFVYPLRWYFSRAAGPQGVVTYSNQHSDVRRQADILTRTKADTCVSTAMPDKEHQNDRTWASVSLSSRTLKCHLRVRLIARHSPLSYFTSTVHRPRSPFTVALPVFRQASLSRFIAESPPEPCCPHGHRRYQRGPPTRGDDATTWQVQPLHPSWAQKHNAPQIMLHPVPTINQRRPSSTLLTLRKPAKNSAHYPSPPLRNHPKAVFWITCHETKGRSFFILARCSSLQFSRIRPTLRSLRHLMC